LLTNPHQPSAALIDYLRSGEQDFVFQVVEVVVIEVKASLEGTIGYSSLAFEEIDDLGKNFIEGHGVTLHSADFRYFVSLQ
jgi:hypothetical protein